MTANLVFHTTKSNGCCIRSNEASTREAQILLRDRIKQLPCGRMIPSRSPQARHESQPLAHRLTPTRKPSADRKLKVKCHGIAELWLDGDL